jgi:hypothetical protein
MKDRGQPRSMQVTTVKEHKGTLIFRKRRDHVGIAMITSLRGISSENELSDALERHGLSLFDQI